MDTKQLRTFVVLAKEKNYIKASEILNYAPSTLAKHIHALEAEFSTTFVHFQNGAICLTKDGEIFLPYAKEMLKMYSDDLAATLANENDTVQEIAIFWTVPYLNDTAKCSYERVPDGFVVMDEMWGNAFS